VSETQQEVVADAGILRQIEAELGLAFFSL
jgi:hypothetical protein